MIKPQVPGNQNDTAETVTVPADVLANMQAQLASLTKQVAQQGKPKNKNQTDEDLPLADKIDITTLKSPVLTRSGWLVPEKFGSNPAAPKV